MSMTVIEHIEVGSGGAASIEFVSVGDIPADYTDLLLVCSVRGSRSNFQDDLLVTFNSATANFSGRLLYGTGASAGSELANTTNINLYANANTATSNTFSSHQIYIPNYASSVAKSVSIDSTAEQNATAALAAIQAHLWNDTDAITSITLSYQNGNFVEYSSATLYGITAGSDGTTIVS